MLRPQSEARRAHCPMEAGGVHVSPERASTRPDQWPDGPGRYCIATRCMWWRWGPYQRLSAWTAAEWAGDDAPPASAFKHPVGDGWEPLQNTLSKSAHSSRWAMQWKRTVDPDRAGYCGGAGRPIEEEP